MTEHNNAPLPNEYELFLAIALLAGAAVLITRARRQVDTVRRAVLVERNKRLDAEDEVERHERNMDGALKKIKEQDDRITDLERAGRAHDGPDPDPGGAAAPAG